MKGLCVRGRGDVCGWLAISLARHSDRGGGGGGGSRRVRRCVYPCICNM